MFCGKELPWEDIDGAWQGRKVWDYPKPCDCPGALEQQRKEEEARAQHRAEKREAARLRRIESLRWKSGLPLRYIGATFESNRRTDSNISAYDKAHGYCDSFLHPASEAPGAILRVEKSKRVEDWIPLDPSMKEEAPKVISSAGLFITGPASSGKTCLAACIVNNLIDQEIPCIFGNVLDLLGRVKGTYSNDRTETEDQVIDDLTNTPLLVIDDLGKEKVSPFVEQLLYQIVNSQYNNLYPVVVTSNFTLTQLEKRYLETGQFIVSRLVEMCKRIELKGDDWRKGIGK